jgi:ATP-dependent helicase/nuclease subunit A
VDIFIEIILKLDSLLAKFKQDNNAYEFNDIAIMAIDILKNNEDIRLELKNKYKEILIDEYQDTNDIQDIFINLIANNNVYMVGDIKQSIYRFRNANPNLFKEKYNSYAKHNGGMKIDLMKNFRSRSNVINGINLIFNALMDDFIGGADYISTHQMVYGNTKYDEVNNEDYQMQILNYEMPEDKKYRKNEIEIFTIAKDIKSKVDNKFKIMDKETGLEKNISYGDFVVLLDRSKDFNLYKKIFEYLNIPITIMRDQTVSDSEDIMIIKNIYNMIMIIERNNFKEDEQLFGYAFMSIARSYLFEINDNDILKIIKDRNYASTKIYEICYQLVKELAVLNNQQLYEKIIKQFDFYNKLIKVGNVKNHLITLDSIAKIVQSTNDMGFTPIDFCNYLNDIAENDLDINLSLNKDTNDSVKIMTIHASKGLEYPICYFAGLTEPFNTRELKDKFNYSDSFGFVIPYLDNKTNSIKNNFVKLLLEKKYIQEEIAEKIRLFYVSLTRSREKMIFVTSLEENMASYKVNGVVDNETRINYRSLADILNSLTSELKNYVLNVNINDIGLTKEYNFSKYDQPMLKIMTGNKINVQEIGSDVTKVTENSFAKKTHIIHSPEEKNNMKLGIEMHYLLETIDFNNPCYDDIDEYKKSIINSFISSGILDNALKIYKEYEFMYTVNDSLEHGVIDLLLIYEDHATIVDYKLKNTQDEAYKKQLAGYKAYIENITGLKTNTYLYSLMNAELLEI